MQGIALHIKQLYSNKANYWLPLLILQYNNTSVNQLSQVSNETTIYYYNVSVSHIQEDLQTQAQNTKLFQLA